MCRRGFKFFFTKFEDSLLQIENEKENEQIALKMAEVFTENISERITLEGYIRKAIDCKHVFTEEQGISWTVLSFTKFQWDAALSRRIYTVYYRYKSWLKCFRSRLMFGEMMILCTVRNGKTHCQRLVLKIYPRILCRYTTKNWEVSVMVSQ